ncbi:hypothetical protein A5893_15790 [Pedobacter psychrophilus]|uniref:Periplasmic heavy metal sensor n=1 Tax=Pedobacter psychrophilus TaxID=1826909 RepID=A0A179DBF9_9SPHI|nr:hypothetical protein [Pedobacter psychrophilus]OAQ38254.1 hypothetical protein A5893_15790 [Pedobacter psychrophilus]
MSKLKLLTIAVIGLLILNFSVLGFLFLHQPPHPERRDDVGNGPKNIIIQKLNFDEKQIADYQILIDEHQTKLKSLRDQVRDTKQLLYKQLNTNNITYSNELENKLGILQTEIEQTHYQHFLQIKKLCKPNQLKNYQELTQELSQLFNQNQPPK